MALLTIKNTSTNPRSLWVGGAPVPAGTTVDLPTVSAVAEVLGQIRRGLFLGGGLEVVAIDQVAWAAEAAENPRSNTAIQAWVTARAGGATFAIATAAMATDVGSRPLDPFERARLQQATKYGFFGMGDPQ